MRKVKLLFTVALALTFVLGASGLAEAKTYNPKHGTLYKVQGYTKKNGTYVKPYKRTKANNTIWDNLYIP